MDKISSLTSTSSELTMPFTGKISIRLGHTENVRRVKNPYIWLYTDGAFLREIKTGIPDKHHDYMVWDVLVHFKLFKVTKISLIIFGKCFFGDNDFVAFGEIGLSEFNNGWDKRNLMIKNKVNRCHLSLLEFKNFFLV